MNEPATLLWVESIGPAPRGGRGGRGSRGNGADAMPRASPSGTYSGAESAIHREPQEIYNRRTPCRPSPSSRMAIG